MKNIPDFELCKKLKEAGFPQPASRFGQFWYADSSARLLVNLKTSPENRPTHIFYEPMARDYIDGGPKETGFVYAPTIPEMVAKMPPVSYFTLSTATVKNEANRCATVWLAFQKAENTHKATASPSQADIMAALKFDADNPKPFCKEARRIAAKHQAEQTEQRAEAFKKRFTPGNNILCRLGGTKRGKIFEMFVLGQSPDQTHVKLQDEAGNAFWKEAQDVEVVNVLGNSSGNTETLTAMDATPQESNAEAILNCLKNIERLLETQKTPEMTPCKRFVAGEDLKPGECVYVSTDGAIMKS